MVAQVRVLFGPGAADDERDRLAEPVVGDAERDRLGEADQATAAQLLDGTRALEGVLEDILPEMLDTHKIRTHGDFHLGQVLIAKDDVFIIDFEGEPNRSIAERRRKAPAARDVAGLIRSIDYSTTAAYERALRNAPDESGRLAEQPSTPPGGDGELESVQQDAYDHEHMFASMPVRRKRPRPSQPRRQTGRTHVPLATNWPLQPTAQREPGHRKAPHRGAFP